MDETLKSETEAEDTATSQAVEAAETDTSGEAVDESVNEPAATGEDSEDGNATDESEATAGDESGDDEPAEEPASVEFSIVFDEDADEDLVAFDEPEPTDGLDALGLTDDFSIPADIAAEAEADADGEADADDTATDEDFAVPRSSSAEITAGNARHVDETLKLAQQDADAAEETVDGHPVDHAAAAEPATSLASRIDREIISNNENAILLKSYPTFSFNKVTLAGAKGKVDIFSELDFACHAGHTYALMPVGDEDMDIPTDAKRVALMGLMSGMTLPTSGMVMNKSANLQELEPIELRGHRLGLVPQRYAVRPDLDAERNVLYAMEASNRNFLKPKPVIARELLDLVGFDEAVTGVAVGTLPTVQQRLVAIARAISTEAQVLILDEPTRGLNDDEAVTVLKALAKLAHSGDPKHCVIIVTTDQEVADTADQIIRV
ncbi:ATP-binding cassette domain-containing protein [Bifidobacterium eulemuris]|nr:ATP-binding cassette domain-containing protein [Bifidobacterium eulemuris]